VSESDWDSDYEEFVDEDDTDEDIKEKEDIVEASPSPPMPSMGATIVS
jgi:hypothetical protein